MLTPPLRIGCTLASLVLLIASYAIIGYSQVPGRNINMVSGTTWPGGDPFLQRQNEPSIAVSSRNPLHLLAGANDYRTVDLPGLPDGETTGDAWPGVFKSLDGGLTWTSTLLPGFPQDTSPEGLASPNKGFQAGADPTVRAGTNGLFYYSGIVFNRDPKGLGQIFVARYIDNNNAERADTMQYVGTSLISTGTSGQLIDKPWLAIDLPRAGAGQCQIGSQSFPAGNAYLSFSIFLGTDKDNNPHTAIMLARSSNCGATWTLIKISESFRTCQGTVSAISPVDGALYVAWRQFAAVNEPDAIVIAKSTDGGRTFSKGKVVATINPFDQGTTPVSFRTNTFPTMAIDGLGRIYIAWAQRGVGPVGDSRIVATMSTNGTNWPAPSCFANDGEKVHCPVDPSPARGHQIMPAMSFAAGKLMLIFYDLREDHTVGIFSPLGDGSYAEMRAPKGDLELGLEAKVFMDTIMDAAPGGLLRRHTIDVRASRADASAAMGPVTFTPSTRVSQYIFGSRPGSSVIEQLQLNPPNFPLFALGTKAFIGDYIDVNATTFVPTPSGWAFNTNPANPSIFHATWTDNRDVRPPLGTPQVWTTYTPAGVNTNPDPNAPPIPSLFDPLQNVAPCISTFAGMRNQNIYTSRLTDGLYIGTASNTKPLGTVQIDGQSVKIQRAFSIFLQNATDFTKSFRLTIPSQPVGGQASFEQFVQTTTVDVTIGPRSTISRPVFATSTDRRAMITVNAVEISAPGGTVVANGLTGSVILNPDRTNPELIDTNIGGNDLTTGEVYNPDITTLPVVLTQDIANQDIANQDIANQDIANQDIANPDIANQDIANQDIANVNIANQDIANQDIANQDIANASLSDATWTVKNEGNTSTSYSVKLLQNIAPPAGSKVQLILSTTNMTLVSRDCALGFQRQNVVIANVTNPVFTSPSDLETSTINDPNKSNATLILAPGQQVKLTVRVLNPDRNNVTFDIAKGISPLLVAHGVNSKDARAGGSRPPVTLTIRTTMNALFDGQKSQDYAATIQAIGGIGPYTWRVSEGSLPTGLTLNSSTGAITGKPTVRGTFTFTVEVKDSASPQHVAVRTLKITIT